MASWPHIVWTSQKSQLESASLYLNMTAYWRAAVNKHSAFVKRNKTAVLLTFVRHEVCQRLSSKQEKQTARDSLHWPARIARQSDWREMHCRERINYIIVIIIMFYLQTLKLGEERAGLPECCSCSTPSLSLVFFPRAQKDGSASSCHLHVNVTLWHVGGRRNVA